MKIVIFAGGVGTRLWPLSRKNTPKQFEKIIGEKSTLQQTVERLSPEFKPEDIYIATGIRYKHIVTEQVPQIPEKNFIFEPEMRDVGPAIGLAATILCEQFPDEPLGILWSDHLVKNINAFKHSLVIAEDIIKTKKGQFVFIAQKARFPNQNIGWIELGEKIGGDNDSEVELYHFKRLRYRPKLDDAVTFFEDKHFVWNLGYFVTTPSYLASLYEDHVPLMYGKLKEIAKSYQTELYEDALSKVYPTMDKISFDDAILEKLRSGGLFVLSADLGWSDIGAWEALKEALAQTEEENVTRGSVMLEDSRDSLVFSYTNQMLVGIDLNKMLVITTSDVVLICPKSAVPKIKKLVENLAGTPHEHLA